MKVHTRRKPKKNFYSGYIFVGAFSLFFVLFVVILSANTGKDTPENVSGAVAAETESAAHNTNDKNTAKQIAPTAETEQTGQDRDDPAESAPQDPNNMSVGSNPLQAKNFATTEAQAAEKLEQLKALFPDGKYWNHAGADKENIFSVTSIPCNHDLNGTKYCNEYESAISSFFPDYSTNIQCLAFAALMSDCIFGPDAPIYETKGFENIRIGDDIRLVDYEHSVIVVDRGADWISVAEVNANYQDCKIAWGRVLTKSELEQYGDSGLIIFSRY